MRTYRNATLLDPLTSCIDFHGHLKVAELLVYRGARVDMSTGMRKQETPLHLAAWNGRVRDCVSVNRPREANLHTTNSNGYWTPLHTASRRGHLEPP